MADRVLPGAGAATLVVLLAFHSGGYFASEWGLIALPFVLIAIAALALAEFVGFSTASCALLLGLAGFAVWQLSSILWSTGAAIPVQETERTLVYVSAVAALLLCLTPIRSASLLTGVAVGITVVAVYALGTRVAPGTLGGAYDPSSGYQLAKPIGYANGLALLLVLGFALSAGLMLHARRPLATLAGAAVVPQLTAVYFTFSRSAFAVLAVAVAVIVALERERLRTIATLSGPLATAAFGTWLCSRNPALTAAGATLHTAQVQGHALARHLLALCLVAAGLSAVARADRWYTHSLRFRPRVSVRTAAVGVVVGLVAGSMAVGGPVSAFGRVTHDFAAPRPLPAAPDPAHRLLSVQGNGRADYWTVAARMVEEHPALGEGSGSFARSWTRERPIADDETRDAHNLYLETLAELGPIGFVLLLLALVSPAAALAHERPTGLMPAAAGAYVAFLLHAAIDWDWEIPILTLVALACAASLIASSRRTSRVTLTGRFRVVGLAGSAALLSAALVAHVGNRAAADAARALARGDAAAAARDAKRARAWMPWSYQPWQLLGEAQFAEGAPRRAGASLRHATSLDGGQWSVWYDLALTEQDRRSETAMAHAHDLNPLGIGHPTILVTEVRP